MAVNKKATDQAAELIINFVDSLTLINPLGVNPLLLKTVFLLLRITLVHTCIVAIGRTLS